MTVSATDNPTKVLVSQSGKKGDPGNNGTDGDGFNQVRYSKLNNPLCHLFKTNQISNASSPLNDSTDVTWVRAGDANYTDRYIAVIPATANTPREEAEGFLIEEASTNVILWSKDATNANWSKNGSAITGNFATSPDGTMTASRWNDSGTSNHFLSQSIGLNNGNKYTLSFWVKSNGASEDNFRLLISGGLTGGDLVATDEWVKYSTTVTIDEAVKSVGLTRDSSDNPCDLLIWNCQLEELDFATSDIFTTSTSASRNDDEVTTVVYNNIPSVTKAWSISCVFTSALKGDASFNTTLVTFGDSLTNQRIVMKDDGSLYLRDSTMLVSLFPAASVIANTKTFLVITYDGVNVTGYLDAVAGTPDAAVMINSTGNTRWGGRPSSDEQLNGHIKDVRFYDFVLNSDEVTYLSGV